VGPFTVSDKPGGTLEQHRQRSVCRIPKRSVWECRLAECMKWEVSTRGECRVLPLTRAVWVCHSTIVNE